MNVDSSQAARETGGRLRASSLGLPGVIFMSVATAAPITAMSGNVPAIIGFGDGAGTPAAYLIVTVILTVFTVGYVTMARYVTVTGSFYGFVTRGLGATPGIMAGLLALFAYLVFEVAIAGAFAYFVQTAVHDQLGISVPWPVLAVLVLLVNGVLAHFHITLAAKILGVFLVLEVAILAAGALAVLFHGGGPDGIPFSALDPRTALSGVPIPATGSAPPGTGSVGFALFLCFWSWVGFESTAVYGEESRDPRRIIPRATLLAVVGIGVFYVFVSWMAVAGNGTAHAVALAQGNSPLDVFFSPTREYLGSWAVTLFQLLTITGSFACSMAFHNCAARYLYALGREGVLGAGPARLGRTHPRHGSPHVASLTQSVVALVLIVVLAVTGLSAYEVFVLVGLLGTLAILVVQAACSFAVISYFHRIRPAARHWWRTYAAPALGGAAMIWVVYLLLVNQADAAGDAANTWLFPAIPYLVVAVALAGLALATLLRSRAPERYAAIGSLITEETTDREERVDR
jgi:amino acid transporter